MNEDSMTDAEFERRARTIWREFYGPIALQLDERLPVGVAILKSQRDAVVVVNV